MHTKGSAVRRAKDESTMYRQGSGFIVSTWDAERGAHHSSPELPHGIARAALACWRRQRALDLLGPEYGYIGLHMATINYGDLSQRDFENVARMPRWAAKNEAIALGMRKAEVEPATPERIAQGRYALGAEAGH